MLKLENVNAGYDFLQVLWDVSINIQECEFLALLGPNGAGKSTTLKTIAGLVKPKSGNIVFKGQDITKLHTHEILKLGISYISESLNLFVNMSIEENLLMGAYTLESDEQKQRMLSYVYDLFPRLAERKRQLSGTLSGGERKMLAIGRGLMCRPSVLLVDEPSLGLAPYLMHNVFDALKILHDEGHTILLVEQNVNATLDITQRAYVLEQGHIVMKGRSSELKKDDHVKNVYLGI
jgi:branched-chain amino acid transport system ATP-binding protein